jgi:hypothetical protein
LKDTSYHHYKTAQILLIVISACHSACINDPAFYCPSLVCYDRLKDTSYHHYKTAQMREMRSSKGFKESEVMVPSLTPDACIKLGFETNCDTLVLGTSTLFGDYAVKSVLLKGVALEPYNCAVYGVSKATDITQFIKEFPKIKFDTAVSGYKKKFDYGEYLKGCNKFPENDIDLPATCSELFYALCTNGDRKISFYSQVDGVSSRITQNRALNMYYLGKYFKSTKRFDVFNPTQPHFSNTKIEYEGYVVNTDIMEIDCAGIFHGFKKGLQKLSKDDDVPLSLKDYKLPRTDEMNKEWVNHMMEIFRV